MSMLREEGKRGEEKKKEKRTKQLITKAFLNLYCTKSNRISNIIKIATI